MKYQLDITLTLEARDVASAIKAVSERLVDWPTAEDIKRDPQQHRLQPRVVGSRIKEL